MSTVNTVSIRTPGDIPVVAEAILMFKPANSLVFLSVGGGSGAHARVDIDPLDEAVEGMVEAAHLWAGGVLVIAYSDTEGIEADVASAMFTLAPAIPILAMVRVDSDGFTYMPGSDHPHPPGEITDPELAARNVVESRETLVAEAAEVHDVEEALVMAEQTYLAGNGARSLCYLDRFIALGGSVDDERALLLGFRLTNGIDPHTIREDAA